MSISAQATRNVSTSTAGAKVFPYSFKILADTDLLVQVDGVTKTLTTDYTVSGVGSDTGGNVTFVTALTAGRTVLRQRNMPYERLTDFQNLGDLRAATLNNDQDAPVLMIQQLSTALGDAAQLSNSTPSALGTVAAGNGTAASRYNHVHPMPTAAQVGADPSGSSASAQAYAVQRANHTGTQAISTVTGLQSALDGKQPLDADLTALAAAGNSGVLAATTASFTTADETKLDGIAAGAEVNVNADWSAGSGDAQILNKPTLGTAASRNVPASGDAAAGEVVLGNDSRLSGGGGGSGTVTSVGLSLPSELSVSGSPVTTTGTLSATWASQTQAKVMASPASSTGTPSFRALAATDVPTLNQNTTGNAGTATALQTARTIDGQSFDGTANITVIAPGTHAATSKATPVDADEIPLVDSAASNVLKRLTWANLKATVKTYFDTLYAAISHTHSLSNLTQSSATTNQVPQWNGSAWVPATVSGGGGGSPGGSDKQLQYNNAGAFGGMAGTSWDDTNRSLTVTGATVTASKPVFDLSQTWNSGGTAFTGWKLNVTDTASDAASLLFDYQVGGTSKISGGKDGFYNCQGFRVYTGGSSYASIYTGGTAGSPVIYGNPSISTEVTLDAYAWWIQILGTRYAGFDGNKTAAMLRSSARILWTSGSDARGTQDTGLARNAAGVVEVNNGTAGTLRDLRARNVRTDATTVSSLVSASTAGAGARGFVTDATATTFLSTVAGGGSNKVPVVSDGTNWLIG